MHSNQRLNQAYVIKILYTTAASKKLIHIIAAVVEVRNNLSPRRSGCYSMQKLLPKFVRAMRRCQFKNSGLHLFPAMLLTL